MNNQTIPQFSFAPHVAMQNVTPDVKNQFSFGTNPSCAQTVNPMNVQHTSANAYNQQNTQNLGNQHTYNQQNLNNQHTYNQQKLNNQQDPLSDLTDAFSKMNIAGGCFSEIFLHFFKTQPNTMINFQPVQYIKTLEGSTKFNSKYEPDFIKQVHMYNSMPCGKYIIEFKKDLTNLFDFYNCVYQIKFTTKNISK